MPFTVFISNAKQKKSFITQGDNKALPSALDDS